MENTIFQRPTKINMTAGGHGTVEYGDDSQLVVIFYTRSVENSALSLQEGRRIFNDQVFVKMHAPGERLNIIDRPANENDKNRFPNQYRAYMHNHTQVPDGTPIDLLFPNTPSIADGLKASGVYTVEQCAGLSAHAMDTIGMGAQDYQNKAKRYIENSKKGANFHQIQAELAQRDQTIKLQQHQIGELKRQLDALQQRFADPVNTSQQPPHISNYDVQSDRINANSTTRLIEQSVGIKPKVTKLKKKPVKKTVDQIREEQSLEDTHIGNAFNSETSESIAEQEGQDY